MRRIQTLLLAAGLVAAPFGAAASPSESTSARSFFQSLSWAATKGRLGVTVMSLSPELRTHFGSTDGTGVLVSHVEPGMPAHRAGIAVGDVITHVHGKIVDDGGDVLTALVDVGKTVRVPVRVLRDRKPLTLDVTMDSDAPSASSTLQSVLDLEWVKRFLDGAREGAARPAT
ncbi:MAG: PDZ domain-containing protein [Myxococcales bacterium]|nr:PDZ domain-containing protein [Myxococcales bacterium]